MDNQRKVAAAYARCQVLGALCGAAALLAVFEFMWWLAAAAGL